jgi:hypothetical protein
MNSAEHSMQNSNPPNFFTYSYLFGIFLLVGSLPYSKFLISVAEITLVISWILEGGLKQKINLFAKNKIALALSSLFLLHLLGLLYTSDFIYGAEDVKKKIPLMLLPLIFSSSTPLSKQMFEKILAVFTLSVLIATFICFYVLLGYTDKEILQPQQASIFTSHIRFGLLISLSVFILGYFAAEKKSMILKITFLLLITWMIMFLIMMESGTGLVCTIAVSAVLLFRIILGISKPALKIAMLSIFILCIAGTIKIFYSTVTQFKNPSITSAGQLPVFTKKGNPYTQDTLSKEVENGNYVWLNICEPELAEEWNSRSNIHYDGKDLRGNEIKYTLIRFLTSKGLNKDAEGVASLSVGEVKAIEKGIPDVNYIVLFNPTARLQKIVWEFDTYLRGGNPSGHSVVQRLEFWKAAFGIIKEHPLIGVGTGDVKDAFANQYDKMNSPLTKEWRLRSHNQFLAICTAFGIMGLIWFLTTLFYPFFANKNFNNYFYLVFFIIAFLSMFGEDTLETQAGVTFFAFFNSFFLFIREKNN